MLCGALRYLFARLLTEGKTLFFSQADCCVRHLLRQNRYDDIVKFEIGLVQGSSTFFCLVHPWKIFYQFYVPL